MVNVVDDSSPDADAEAGGDVVARILGVSRLGVRRHDAMRPPDPEVDAFEAVRSVRGREEEQVSTFSHEVARMQG